MEAIIKELTEKQNEIHKKMIKVRVEINAMKNMVKDKSFLKSEVKEMEMFKQDFEKKIKAKYDKLDELIKMYNDNINLYVLHNL